ncbi:MAG TPA: serine/threonine-protein kinase [Gaiellaceae bacterium]|nr:serine/threonine-protein kinase [Gaiellaceae bacterium]
MRPGDEVAGRYRLDDLQGHGPMSQVWRAHDDTLDRTVALKLLSPTADLARFRREAQALAGLAHENVMRVYDYGEDEAGPFMALEWLAGGTLENRLAQGPLPPEETYRIAQAIAGGLAHLHDRGLIHRDLKPANVLFDEEGRPKLGDFGLARHVAGSGTLTEAGTVLGTAAYISPEQAAGEPAGVASDVYSFGVILFRMLTGALPFEADNAVALADMHRHAQPPAVETLQPDAPPALAALAAAALRKDPAQRPPDGEALLSALGAAPAAALEPTTEVTQVLPPVPAEPPTRRLGRGTAAAAVGLVILAAGGGILAWAVTRPGTPAPAGVPGPDTHRHSHTGTTQATLAPSTQSSTHARHRTTTGHTTTAASTSRSTTTATTTAPVTTPPTTTLPTTTLPTTTLPTTTLPTTAGIGVTTTATGTT